MSKKKRIDPIIQLAEKNRKKSLSMMQDENNEKQIRSNNNIGGRNKDKFQSQIEDSRLNGFFRDMKRRDF